MGINQYPLRSKYHVIFSDPQPKSWMDPQGIFLQSLSFNSKIVKMTYLMLIQADRSNLLQPDLIRLNSQILWKIKNIT